MSKRKLPPCAQSMGCLCAGHARGDSANKPCDTSEVALTERMRAVLTALDKADRPLPPNMIAVRCGFTSGHLPGKPQCNHAGRHMGPAQRIIFALNALHKRGFVRYGRRPDGLSGTAYEITGAGRKALR